MKFSVQDHGEYVVVEFTLEGPITPDILGSLEPPSVPGGKGVVLSGRGPVWLYGYMITYYVSVVPFLATHDPRLGHVVVCSPGSDHAPGNVID